MAKIGFIGMGNMGYAMLKGLLKTYSPADIVFSCATDKKRVTVSDETGVKAASGNAACGDRNRVGGASFGIDIPYTAYNR